jgi:DNA-binding MarR family transcriptional regulator
MIKTIGKLTARQFEIYSFVKSYGARHGGLSPTYQELAVKFGVTRGAVRQNIDLIERKGYLKRTGNVRGIKILR